MLLPDNIRPENSIYYNGAFLIQVLKEKNNLDMLELYQEVKKIKNMTFPIFTLCIDWLYLANIAELSNGRIKLCS
ncbi:MAG: hypothetical protein COV98_01265 [Candidatus Altarchaeum sp. CG12_big_fil_rev_8_21_14_0_65_33_22]|nr:MAG: hypothetical protein AUK59_00910 [Candidatus Altarchaeum sp. CG2_30_32_3053]PIN67857.1 MAG: hypothetical protein COV98_01265 [Candidatus Altarchaeum sp. CG12_big_fil_rev_8_21_14_0_65_33_22]PIV27238.1 MAG: hypothetical protein COS36_06430 [Candidatus Altarchaeum sp. CG03_land_8_20_14_0_80_32_618]